jgi:NAD(P)-dependent dehydrogenase (short-subunit alcohol dehydrogenase family)
MDLRLAGKTALVSGGSAGIGLAIAHLLVTEGVSVAIAARNPDRLAGAAEALNAAAHARGGEAPRVLAIAADLSKADDVSRVARDAAEALGRIDILVNNAGSAMGGKFLELGDEAYLNAWTLKALGYIRMTRAVVPAMIARRDGRIVNIVGGAARNPSPLFLSGSTGNAAIINFTRGIAKDLAPHNVRINAVSPGVTQTERGERLLAAEVKDGQTIEDAREARLNRIPMRLVTLPDEIASMTALIVSDRMATMTGTEVIVDGGSMPTI